MNGNINFPVRHHNLRKAVYVPVLATAMLMMLGRLLIFAKILTIEAFAQLSSILIVSSIIGMLASSGFYLDLQRTLPSYIALGQRRSGAVAIWQSLIGTFMTGAVGLLIAGTGISVGSLSSVEIGFGVVHGVAQQIFLVQTTESRSENDPLRFALENLTRAVAIFAFALPIVLMLKTAYAIVISECLVTSLVSFLIARQISSRLLLSHKFAMLIALRSLKTANWKSILALLLLSLAVTASTSADRWLASIKLQPFEFAQYALASIVITASSAMQQLVNTSIFPMIARRFALYGLRPAYRLCATVSFSMLAIFFASSWPALYLLDLAIVRFYPNYEQSIPIISVLLLSAAFRVSDFWTGFLVIDKQEKASLSINILSVASGILLWSAGLFGSPSSGLAIAYLATFISTATYLSSLALSYRCYQKAAGAV